MMNPILAISISVGFETLRANPLRTILSTLGIVIGVGALVSVLSVGDGMERLAREQIGRTTDLQRISITPRLFRLIDGTPFPISDPLKFSLTEAEAVRKIVGDSTTVNMVVSGVALVTVRGDTTPYATQVTGMLMRDGRLSDTLVLAGRVFTDAEAASGVPVVVVSYRLAADVARGRQPSAIVGDTLLFQGKPRQVVGVLKAELNDRARRALMPVTAATGAIVVGQAGDRPAQLVLTARSIEAVAPTRTLLERWSAQQFGASWKDRVSIVTDESRVEQTRKALLIFKLFMGALMSISLIVGGIGIMNVLLSSVIERTREIGIRKATGAAQRHILWQFLCESVAITGVGSMIGLVIGVGAAFGITAIMRRVANTPIQAWLSVSTVLVAIGASVLVGVLFGLYPAMRAARLSPIDAIHHE
jgi:putative ABC transport system permease protein